MARYRGSRSVVAKVSAPPKTRWTARVSSFQIDPEEGSRRLLPEMTGATETFADLAFSTQLIERQLKATGVAVIGRVWESKCAYDLALRNGNGRTIVVRCVAEPHATDHITLATMLAEGDFTRAFIVYTAEDQPHLSGEIETYPLSRIDELAALLAKESPP
jgi:hypothetical protein